MDKNKIELQSNELFKNWTDEKVFLKELDKLPSDVLIFTLPRLRSTGETGEKMKALRDVVMTKIQVNLSNELISHMTKLDKSASILSIIGLILSVVIGVAGIIIPLIKNLAKSI